MPNDIIYTIGFTLDYERYFLSQDRVIKQGRTNDYPGGGVWQTFEEAKAHCDKNEGFSVYGVIANWDDTAESKDGGGMRHLLRDSKLIKLEGVQFNA